MEVNVRLMLESDIPQVIAIENYWDYLSKWGKEGYTKVLQNSYIYYSLVAETKYHSKFPSSVSDTKIIGLAVLAFLFDHGDLCNLVVSPQYLGKGIGQQLLSKCLEVAKQGYLNRILLEVRHSNHRAVRFYQRNDFRITANRKNYYSHPPEDAWVMERLILSPGCRDSGEV